MSGSPPLLDAHNATLWRGRTRVFDDLSLTIEQHERIAVLGPNGCGKTTLLKTINRELYPVVKADSHLRILGRDHWNVWELRKQIGVVSDDLQQRYTATTSAIEVVVSGFHASIGVHGVLSSRVTRAQIDAAMRALDSLAIAALRDTPLKNMSSGQKRRCLLARALVHNPGILIFDEPTAGLDFAASFDFLDQVRQLAQQGRSIVVVTHYLNEIPPEVDRVVLLQSGRIVADGSKQDVLTDSLLSRVYGRAIRVVEVDGYYLAYPGEKKHD